MASALPGETLAFLLLEALSEGAESAMLHEEVPPERDKPPACLLAVSMDDRSFMHIS